jgi:hypothetical protein
MQGAEAFGALFHALPVPGEAPGTFFRADDFEPLFWPTPE